MINTAKLNSFAEEGWIHFTQRVHDFSPFWGIKSLSFQFPLGLQATDWAMVLFFSWLFSGFPFRMNTRVFFHNFFSAKLAQHAPADNDRPLYLALLEDRPPAFSTCFFLPIFFLSLDKRAIFSAYTSQKYRLTANPGQTEANLRTLASVYRIQCKYRCSISQQWAIC